ncbi:hypothetical protein VPH35_086838 [Triticum aestivum]
MVLKKRCCQTRTKLTMRTYDCHSGGLDSYMLLPRGSNLLQIKLGTRTRISPSSVIINYKQEPNEIVTKGARDRGGREVRSGPVVIWLGRGGEGSLPATKDHLKKKKKKKRRAKDGAKVRRAGSGLPSPPSAPPASLSGPVPPLHRTHARSLARSPDSNPPPTSPFLLSGPSNPTPPNPLLLVPLARPRLDPEGISPAGLPPIPRPTPQLGGILESSSLQASASARKIQFGWIPAPEPEPGRRCPT